ncbi:MAG: hypothetical protein F4W68_08010 [Cenarchaeum sp. SB0661_bin_35]|nr:hypothetical protein [Cenarchaeum sp. SB0667_bin_13]MYC80422.1 hypothetical protein [Cenarchaeum sp. SB0661_bin_35]
MSKPPVESSEDWVAKYYDRIVGECKISFERRDRVTHWSYMVLGAFMGVYVGFTAGIDTNPMLRFALTATILAIMTRFFFQSTIAYSFYLRYRYIRTKIEEHWMDKTDIEEIEKEIRKFDHGKHNPATKNRIAGQIRSGPLVLILPVILLVHGFEIGSFWYYVILVALIGYVVYEIWNYVTYDQIKSKS